MVLNAPVASQVFIATCLLQIDGGVKNCIAKMTSGSNGLLDAQAERTTATESLKATDSLTLTTFRETTPAQMQQCGARRIFPPKSIPMSKKVDRARARRLIERVVSRRAVEGPYSVFGRLRPEAIEPMAEQISRTYPNTMLDEEDLRRCALLYVGRHPAAARSAQETTAIINQRRMNDQKQHVVRDVDKGLLARMTPEERLTYVNSDGKILPYRFLLKGPHDE